MSNINARSRFFQEQMIRLHAVHPRHVEKIQQAHRNMSRCVKARRWSKKNQRRANKWTYVFQSYAVKLLKQIHATEPVKEHIYASQL